MKYITVLMACVVVCFIFSCSKKLNKQATEAIIVYPAPPDTARIQYLTSISSSADIANKKSGLSKFIVGEEKAQGITKPYGVTMRNGKIYVSDISAETVEIINLEDKTFEYLNTNGLGILKSPLNCYVDENNQLYVADGDRRQIVIYDQSGNYVDAFGEAENFKPTDVFVYDSLIWVSNIKNNRIHVYHKDTYEPLYTFPQAEEGNEDYLFSPLSIFITKEKVYVTDFGDFKVKIYAHDGTFIRSVGSYGRNIGQFVRPKGIAVDRDNNLYVVDAGFENVQIFDDDGNLLMFFGGSYTGPGGLWLPTTISIDYDGVKYFEKYVAEQFNLKYVILVANQFGPDKINVYGYVEMKE